MSSRTYIIIFMNFQEPQSSHFSFLSFIPHWYDWVRGERWAGDLAQRFFCELCGSFQIPCDSKGPLESWSKYSQRTLMCWKALLHLCLRHLNGSTVSSFQQSGEKPGNYGLKGNYNGAHNFSLISQSSLLVNNQSPSFQGTPPSHFPTGVGEAESGQGNWVLPGESGVKWTQFLELISYGSRDVPRISPLGSRTG